MASNSSKELLAGELLLLLMPFVFHFVFYKFIFFCFEIQVLLDFLRLSAGIMFLMSTLILDCFDRCKMITALSCLALLHTSFVTGEKAGSIDKKNTNTETSSGESQTARGPTSSPGAGIPGNTFGIPDNTFDLSAMSGLLDVQYLLLLLIVSFV